MTTRRIRPAAIAAVGILATVAAGSLAAAPATADPAPGAFLAPYYTELDLTGDEQVTTDDLTLLGEHLGDTPSSPEWAKCGSRRCGRR